MQKQRLKAIKNMSDRKSNLSFISNAYYFYKKALIMGIFLSISPQSFSHSGGTNASGCHGGSQPYHCHGGGSSGGGSIYGNENSDATLRRSIKKAVYNPNKKNYSDDEIKLLLIKRSINKYKGNCPCPYFKDRSEMRCGMESAWSRPGGASPLCYKSDVSQEMVQYIRTQVL